MFKKREQHVWVLTSDVFQNINGVVGVFKTEYKAKEYAEEAGMDQSEYQLEGWVIEKS